MTIRITYFFTPFFRFMIALSESGIGSATSRTPHETKSRIDPATCDFGFFFGMGDGFMVIV